MAHCSRRDFLKTGLAAGVLAGAGSLPVKAARGTATDWVTLGKSGVKVTRLAFGTGTFSGQVQRDLGQEQFTKLIRHAHERGIRVMVALLGAPVGYPAVHDAFQRVWLAVAVSTVAAAVTAFGMTPRTGAAPAAVAPRELEVEPA